MAGKILTATETFATEAEGHLRVVRRGETFREGHRLVKAHPGAFEVQGVDNEAPPKPSRQKR